MTNYEKEYREFSLHVPERFSFPIDVFDKWGDQLALFWTDGTIEKSSPLMNQSSSHQKAQAPLKIWALIMETRFL